MKYFGWIFLFFIFVYIVPLGSRPMFSPGEFQYAETAREMIFSGSYVTAADSGVFAANQMPLDHWLTVGSFKLFGINSFAARLPSALAVGLTALLIALLIQQSLRDQKLGALSAIIFMTFSITLLTGGTAGSGAVFTVFASASLGTLFLAAQETAFNRRKLLLIIISGISAALTFLSGGLYAVILLLLISLFYLLFNCRFKELLILPGWLICAVLVLLPWGFHAAEKIPGFWCEIFSWQNFKAITGCTGTWYRTLLYPAIGLFPVIVILPTAVMAGKEAWTRMLRQPLCRFALLAFLLPAVYFAALRCLPQGMTLLMFPALSILTAMGIQAYFNRGGHHRTFDWMLNIWGLFLIITGGMEIAVWYFRESLLQEYFTLLPITRLFLINLGVSSLIGGTVLLYSLRGNWRSRLYLFFFSVAILPLGISWCFSSDSRMPEAIFKKFIRQMDILTDESTFITSKDFTPALSWCTENRNVIAIADGQELHCCGSEVCYVLLKNDDPAWQNLPKPEKIIIIEQFSCARFSGHRDCAKK